MTLGGGRGARRRLVVVDVVNMGNNHGDFGFMILLLLLRDILKSKFGSVATWNATAVRSMALCMGVRFHFVLF